MKKISQKQIKFEEAILKNDIELFSKMISDKSIDLNRDNGIPLYKAITNNCLFISKCLILEHNLDPSVEDNLALKNAFLFDFSEMVHFLLLNNNVLNKIKNDNQDNTHTVKSIQSLIKLNNF